MAEYSYETYEDLRKSSQQSTQKRQRSRVGYFKLNENEDAIVRFDYSSPKEMGLITVHNVKVGDKYRKVSCLRVDGREPLDNCPLCASGEKCSTRFFAKLVHYTKDEAGKVVATPEIANFPKNFADKLIPFFQDYGDLKEVLIKIHRTGSGTSTEYTPYFANPAVYKEELGYIKDFKDLDELDLAHHSYVVKSREDIEEYLKTGEFPYHKPATQEVKSSEFHQGNLELPDDTDMISVLGLKEETNVETQPQRTYTQPEQRPNTPTSGDITNRPRRTYDFSK